MKKISLKVATCLVAGGFLFNSCIGSYSLFNKFAQWELHMTSSKYLNAIIGFVIDIVCVPITLIFRRSKTLQGINISPRISNSRG